MGRSKKETDYSEFYVNNLDEDLPVRENKDKRTKKKKRKKKKSVIVSIILIITLIVLVVALFIIENSFVYARCEVEAGTPVALSDLLKRPDKDAYITEDSDKIDIYVPGDYHLKVKTGIFEHPVTVVVKDTVPPEVKFMELATGMGYLPEPSDFVTEIVDVTKCTVSYVKKPDVGKLGETSATIEVKDLGGNAVTKDLRIDVWPIKGYLRMEAGSDRPKLADFMLKGDVTGAQMISNMETIDMSDVDVVPIKIKFKGTSYEPKLIIYDSRPPEFSVKNIDSFLNVPRKAEDFVTDTRDNSKVTYTFESEPDLTKEGTQTLVVVGTDGGGNRTSHEVKLTLRKDTEKPKFNNVKDIKIFVGRTISYKNNLEVTDNCPEGLKLEVDAGNVNTNVVGTYNATATATDIAGNTASASFKVIVSDVASTIEDLNILVDEVLGQIVTPGMNTMQKIRACYDYVYTHCRYRDMNIDDNWIKAAASGFLTGKGDCYTDTMMAKALLDRIRVKNKVISRIHGNDADHYWNLVDIGDEYGWYHLDCINRLDGVAENRVFMLKTDQLIEVDNRIGDFHDFDRTKYPDVDPGTVAFTGNTIISTHPIEGVPHITPSSASAESHESTEGQQTEGNQQNSEESGSRAPENELNEYGDQNNGVPAGNE